MYYPESNQLSNGLLTWRKIRLAGFVQLVGPLLILIRLNAVSLRRVYPIFSIWCSLGILLNKYLRVVVSWRKARRPREDRRRRMCELGLAEDFYRRGKDVPYILIKVDPKPRKAGRHNSKPRRKKERQKLRLDFTLFPRGISLNGTLVPPMFRFIFFWQEL